MKGGYTSRKKRAQRVTGKRDTHEPSLVASHGSTLRKEVLTEVFTKDLGF
jgi:hypothetical protein